MWFRLVCVKKDRKAKIVFDLRDKIREHKLDLGLLQKKPCTKDETEEYTKIIKNGGHRPAQYFKYKNESNL